MKGEKMITTEEAIKVNRQDALFKQRPDAQRILFRLNQKPDGQAMYHEYLKDKAYVGDLDEELKGMSTNDSRYSYISDLRIKAQDLINQAETSLFQPPTTFQVFTEHLPFLFGDLRDKLVDLTKRVIEGLQWKKE